MDNRFGGIIWTNHALERLRERNISQSQAYLAYDRPDDKRYAVTKGAWVCTRKVDRQIIEVVASQNERKEWVIMSVWSKPAFGFATKTNKITSFGEKIVQKILKRLFGRWQEKFKKPLNG